MGVKTDNGEFASDWSKTDSAVTNPAFKCPNCGARNISFRCWESDCGGFEDFQYRCDACDHTWWVESADS